MREKPPCDAVERIPRRDISPEGIYAFSDSFQSCFLELDILEVVIGSPCGIEEFFSFFHPDIFTIDDISREECQRSSRDITESHRMIDRMDISTIEIDLEGGSTDSGDDVVLRKSCLEV